ncbi:hypothetical protein [Vreelandella lionensis]|uniref:hypothetical protein n=1 Tax=Vreelandella lionensis TaxID=1144478 RepID=UPI001FB3F0C3|nr:hypothetical protein [Halomonas lionensis]
MRVHPHSLWRIVILSLATFVLATKAMSTQAQTRIIDKSALAGTAYHQMGAELAQAIRQDSSGTVLLSNEESQGSVQNVMEVAAREGLYMFTSPQRWLLKPCQARNRLAVEITGTFTLFEVSSPSHR